MLCFVTVHEYIIPHVLVLRQHNGDDPPQDTECEYYGLLGCVAG